MNAATLAARPHSLTHRPSAWAGAALLLLAVVVPLAGGWLSPAEVWSAWLAADWWCLGLVLGAVAAWCIQRLSGGQWGRIVGPAAAALAGRLPWLLLLLAPLLLALPALYPWAAADGGAWARGLARPGFKLAWLSPAFFVARAALYMLAAWWLARPAALAAMGQGRAALSLIAYLLLGSLAGVDVIGSLMPRWSSSVFGLLLLSAQLLSGLAACVLLMARAPRSPALERREPGKPPVWRDMGNMLLMAILLWGYLAFMQFLIIWAENLPEEIAWYLPRLVTGWRFASVALVLLHLALPLVLLLWRSLKDRPQLLAPIAALILAGNLLETAWLVVPSVAPHGWSALGLVPLQALGMGLLAFGGIRAIPLEASDGPA